MSTYKPVADVIQEIEYWLRLATFQHEPLKNALLAVLHNTANDPTYTGLPDDVFLLYQEFSKHGNKIAKLMKRGVLQQDQVDLLLPPNDNKTDSSKFDITLIAVLIRNFTTLQPPLNGWNDKNPPNHDRSKGAAVIRGREWRNFVNHIYPKNVDIATFNQKWLEGTQIITDLGYQYDEKKLKTISLDPRHEVVLKSLYSYMAQLEKISDIKHDSHTQQITDLAQQLQKIQKYLRAEKGMVNKSSLPSTDGKSFNEMLFSQQLKKIQIDVEYLRSEKGIKNKSSSPSTGSRKRLEIDISLSPKSQKFVEKVLESFSANKEHKAIKTEEFSAVKEHEAIITEEISANKEYEAIKTETFSANKQHEAIITEKYFCEDLDSVVVPEITELIQESLKVALAKTKKVANIVIDEKTFDKFHCCEVYTNVNETESIVSLCIDHDKFNNPLYHDAFSKESKILWGELKDAVVGYVEKDLKYPIKLTRRSWRPGSIQITLRIKKLPNGNFTAPEKEEIISFIRDLPDRHNFFTNHTFTANVEDDQRTDIDDYEVVLSFIDR